MKEDNVNCLNCGFYDMNDVVNAFGTCDPQGKDFHCTHVCNISIKDIEELESLTGRKRIEGNKQ